MYNPARTPAGIELFTGNEKHMDLYKLTRTLIDIESVTGNEKQMGLFLIDYLSELAGRTGGRVERMHVEQDRFNVFAQWDQPYVTLSTHQDVVPPHFASSEDDVCVYGRGACDTKGISASMIKAAEKLLAEGVRNFGLLFVVGEERNSAGAFAAARENRGSRYLINGEPTENKLALGSKGALRYEMVARGRMAHSAYPELGESAIEKLLDVLDDVRRIPMPQDPVLGQSSLNIGTVAGGRAPNIVPDSARAEIMIRLVDSGDSLRAAMAEAAGGRVELKEVLCIPAVRLGALDGIDTTVVSYTTDIPAFGRTWGEPFLIGPGTIHVAHTLDEKVPKKQLDEAVDIYAGMVKTLLARA